MVWEVGRNTTMPGVGEIIRLVLIQERVAAVNLELTTFWTGQLPFQFNTKCVLSASFILVTLPLSTGKTIRVTIRPTRNGRFPSATCLWHCAMDLEILTILLERTGPFSVHSRPSRHG